MIKIESSLELVQPLLWDVKGKPLGIESLYFSLKGSVLIDNSIELKSGGYIDFFSTFNLFNIDRWQKYTFAENLTLCLELIGTFRIRLFSHSVNKKGVEPVFDKIETVKGSIVIPVPLLESGGIYSLKIDALEDGLVLGGGWYVSTAKNVERNNRVAIVICTYRREEYLEGNLKILQGTLPEGCGVFFVDNGRTLTDKLTDSFDDRFHFYSNPNTGGSGGFTRGLMEVLDHKGKWSHVLFMDDDIIIEPAALKRTGSFLKMLKPEYYEYFLSGAMLRLDYPTIQHESVSRWNGLRIRGFNKDLDLSLPYQILKNERDSKKNNLYAAWWYCVIPIMDNMSEDLPFPMFVNGDDIEYSLRRAKGIIRLNGVSVWHEPFHLKMNAVKHFYLTTRNVMVINMLHNYSRLHTLLNFYLRMVLQLRHGNMEGIKLIARGFEEFLKGPEVFMSEENSRLFLPEYKDELLSGKFNFLKVVGLSYKYLKDYKKLKLVYKEFPLNEKTWNTINNV